MGIEKQTGYWISIEFEDSEKYILTLRGFRGEQDLHAVYNKEYKTLVNTASYIKIPTIGKIPESEAKKVTLNGLFLSGLPVIEVASGEERKVGDPIITTLIDISSFLQEEIEPLNDGDILIIKTS